MEMLNWFTLFKDSVDNEFKSFIKSYYVFDINYYNNRHENALFVTIDDKVFGFGYNNDGVCGQGYNRRINKPLVITELSDKKVKEFFNGGDFVLCLTSDNKLFSWGRNDHGQLGIGCVMMDKYYEPQLIEFFNDKNIVQVCCGARHSLVLTEEGVVYGWGDNEYGQTGGGQSEYEITSPKPWPIDVKVSKIYCAPKQSYAITGEGKVYQCGSIIPDQIESVKRVNLPKLIDKINNVKSIIASNGYLYFITTSGDIYLQDYINEMPAQSFNNPFESYVFNIDNLNEAISLSSSNYFYNCLDCAIIKSHDSIYEINAHKYTKTNYKSLEEFFFEKYKVTYKTIHINHDNIETNLISCKLITNNYNPYYLRYENQIDKFEICHNISENLKQIIKYFYIFKTFSKYGFTYNILFVTIDDQVFGMGNNDFGVLGLGYPGEVNKPKIAPRLCDIGAKNFYHGLNFALCITKHNTLFSWGRNNYGQLGIGLKNDFKIYKPVLIDYFNDKKIVQISCGQTHVTVLTSDGNVHLWGQYDGTHKLRPFIIEPIVLEIVPQIKLIHCSNDSTFCVTQCGNVYYWKYEKQFDSANDQTYRLKLISIDISNIEFICSYFYGIYLISSDSKIYICEIRSKKLKPIIISMNIDSGFRGTNDVVTLPFIITCTIHNDNCVYEFNKSEMLQTKYKNPLDYYCDIFGITHKTIELNVDEKYIKSATNITNPFLKNFIKQENDLSNTILEPFSIAEKVLKSMIKYFYIFYDPKGFNMLYVANDNQVYGLGSNEEGLCGLGHKDEVIDPKPILQLCHEDVIKFFSGRYFAMALTSDNKLYAWGKINDQNNYSVPTKIFEFDCEINSITCSGYHVLFLTKDGIVYIWGNNWKGLIANKEDSFIYTPLKLDALKIKLPKIKLITCNTLLSIAVSEDNKIFVWGKSIKNYIVIECHDDILNICVINDISYISINDVLNFHSINENNYLCILTTNREILYCRFHNSQFKKIECPYYIESIHSNHLLNERKFSHKWEMVVVTKKGVYYIRHGKKLVRTQYKTIHDYFAEEYQITYKTIDMKLQNEIQTKSLQIRGKINYNNRFVLIV